MSKYQADQIAAFLRAVDDHLTTEVELLIVGGGAALLQHGARSPTRDIDTFGSNLTGLKPALVAAQAQVGYAVPIESADIGDLPLNYEDRQIEPLSGLRKLRVVVPEQHDLVLSKLLRATQADLQVCREVHEHKALSTPTLFNRYLAEMNHAIGPQLDRDMNFVAGVEYIWDAETADRAQLHIDQRRATERRQASGGRGRGRSGQGQSS